MLRPTVIGVFRMFDDPDPIEEEMGVKVEQMSPDQLIAYLKTLETAKAP